MATGLRLYAGHGMLTWYWKRMVSQELRRSWATPWSEASVTPSSDVV